MDLDDFKKFGKELKDTVSEKAPGVISKGLRGSFGTVGKTMSGRYASPVILPSEYDYIPQPVSKHFTVGFGKASILPNDILIKKYYIAGYSDNNPAQGVLDAPHAHAVWIDDNSNRGGILFISIDNVGMLNSDVNNIRASLSEFSKISGCRSINIMSTHNHAGIDTMGNWGHLPLTGRDPSYMSFVLNQVKKASFAAYRDKRQGDIYRGSIEVPDMQEDIRLPIVYSKTLTRLRFVPKDGSREIYMLNFASHSESLQGCNDRVSADFPGYMRDEIREKTGAETIYFVGAIGGMISMEIENESEIRANGGDFAESTRNIGKKLAGYAMSIKNEKKIKPKIDFIRQEFYFEADNTVLMLAKTANILKAKCYYQPWTSMGLALKSEMSYFEIGDLHLLMLPCELFPELAYGGYLSAEESSSGFGGEINPLPLTQIAGDKELLIFGLANDEVGYVVPPNDFLLNPESPYLETVRDRLGRKHYEETNSLGPNTADKIAEVFEAIFKTVQETKQK